MKVKTFEYTLTANFAFIPGVPKSMQALQIENLAGNAVVQYRMGGGASRPLPATAWAEWSAKPDDQLHNGLEVKGTGGQILVGEFWVKSGQI